MADEILEDRKGLEMLTGTLVWGHAYPNGSYNEESKTLFRQLGSTYGRVVQFVPNFELPANLMGWHPTCHHNDSKLMRKAEYLVDLNRCRHLKLMYIWGHSHEFDRHDNRNVMEEFCGLVGGREDIWYSTNIEIIDYLESAKNLGFSANYHRVYNPDVQSVWLHIWDERYAEVKGGEYADLSDTGFAGGPRSAIKVLFNSNDQESS